MKKFGFTLSELLITVGIVGVVAALTAPAVSNIMPDKNKMMFMKNYKELTTITEKLLQDPELYYTTYTLDIETGRKKANCIGLQCRQIPKKYPYNTDKFKDGQKYQYLLASYLGVEDAKLGKNFRTSDNTYWEIMGGVSNGVLQWYEVTFSVNQNEDSVGSLFDTTESPKTNTFKLKVDYYGNVTPVDYLSQAYLLNQTNMNNKKKDLACAKAIKADTTGKAPADICAELDD